MMGRRSGDQGRSRARQSLHTVIQYLGVVIDIFRSSGPIAAVEGVDRWPKAKTKAAKDKRQRIATALASGEATVCVGPSTSPSAVNRPVLYIASILIMRRAAYGNVSADAYSRQMNTTPIWVSSRQIVWHVLAG